jgi:hypothetical protein
MIKFSETGYDLDPVQSIFHKSNYQTDIEASNQFPARIRMEKREIEYLNCDIILTEFNGLRWNLITGLQAVKSEPGYFIGNKIVNDTSRVFTNNYQKRKTEMLVIHNNGLTGQLHLYHFRNYDLLTTTQRMKAAKDFISFLNKKIGHP